MDQLRGRVLGGHVAADRRRSGARDCSRRGALAVQPPRDGSAALAVELVVRVVLRVRHVRRRARPGSSVPGVVVIVRPARVPRQLAAVRPGGDQCVHRIPGQPDHHTAGAGRDQRPARAVEHRPALGGPATDVLPDQLLGGRQQRLQGASRPLSDTAARGLWPLHPQDTIETGHGSASVQTGADILRTEIQEDVQ